MRFVIVNRRNGMACVFQDEETGLQTMFLDENIDRRHANHIAENMGEFEAMTEQEFKEYRWNFGRYRNVEQQ